MLFRLSAFQTVGYYKAGPAAPLLPFHTEDLTDILQTKNTLGSLTVKTHPVDIFLSLL